MPADLRKCGGAPGRIRTCDTRFRRAVLYPLSYEGGVWLEPSSGTGPSHTAASVVETGPSIARGFLRVLLLEPEGGGVRPVERCADRTDGTSTSGSRTRSTR